MSQADLQAVLSHLDRLQPDELREVSRVVEQRLATDSLQYGEQDEAFLQALKEGGLISTIRRPPPDSGLNSSPCRYRANWFLRRSSRSAGEWPRTSSIAVRW